MASHRPTDIFIRSTSGRDNIATHPSVGIFWGVFIQNGLFLINEKAPLHEAEPYGDFFSYSHGHFEIWEPLTRMSDSQLGRAKLQTVFHTDPMSALATPFC